VTWAGDTKTLTPSILSTCTNVPAGIVWFSVLRAVSRPQWAAALPKDLPVLVISGQDDPVGDYGDGVRQVCHRLREAGLQDVQLVLYDAMRHEILNERERERVYADILLWCDAVLEKS